MKKMFDAEFARKFGLDNPSESSLESDYSYDFNQRYYDKSEVN